MTRPIVLVLRALGLGDYLTGLPALSLLRRALPGHEVVLVAPPALGPLVALTPCVDRLLPRGELEPIRWDGPAIDIAVDLHGKGPASRLLLTASAPRHLVGFADPSAGLTGPDWRAGEHEVIRWQRLIIESLICTDAQAGRSVAGLMRRPVGAAPNGLTLIHPGAAAGARRWPVDRFIALAVGLLARGHRVAVSGGPDEGGLVAAVCAGSAATPMVGRSLDQLAAEVAGARMVVCGDTGVAHLASAYGVPSVILFGPVSPAEWGPPPHGRHVVLWHGDGTGDAHGVLPDPALLQISVEEVLAAVLTNDAVSPVGDG